ncbi:hypothetical protein BJF90_13635 [Pseudonocardia sp. CNS-004]|nr:hypothetical protein BJF90_13635 [Pseudonocardia sp. CNS-004]
MDRFGFAARPEVPATARAPATPSSWNGRGRIRRSDRATASASGSSRPVAAVTSFAPGFPVLLDEAVDAVRLDACVVPRPLVVTLVEPLQGEPVHRGDGHPGRLLEQLPGLAVFLRELLDPRVREDLVRPRRLVRIGPQQPEVQVDLCDRVVLVRQQPFHAAEQERAHRAWGPRPDRAGRIGRDEEDADPGEDLHEEVLLAGEAVVERGERCPRGFGDAPSRRAAYAVLGDHGDGGLDEFVLALLHRDVWHDDLSCI